MRVTLQHAGAQAGRQAAGRALTQDWEDEAAGVDLQGGGGRGVDAARGWDGAALAGCGTAAASHARKCGQMVE